MTYSCIKEVFSEMRALMIVNGYSSYALNEIEKTFDKAVAQIRQECYNCENRGKGGCISCKWSWNGE